MHYTDGVLPPRGGKGRHSNRISKYSFDMLTVEVITDFDNGIAGRTMWYGSTFELSIVEFSALKHRVTSAMSSYMRNPLHAEFFLDKKLEMTVQNIQRLGPDGVIQHGQQVGVYLTWRR